jgi:hypothetical protein
VPRSWLALRQIWRFLAPTRCGWCAAAACAQRSTAEHGRHRHRGWLSSMQRIFEPCLADIVVRDGEELTVDGPSQLAMALGLAQGAYAKYRGRYRFRRLRPTLRQSPHGAAAGRDEIGCGRAGRRP